MPYCRSAFPLTSDSALSQSSRSRPSSSVAEFVKLVGALSNFLLNLLDRFSQLPFFHALWVRLFHSGVSSVPMNDLCLPLLVNLSKINSCAKLPPTCRAMPIPKLLNIRPALRSDCG